MKTKICSKCKQKLLIKEFYKKKSSKDGYRAECKRCRKKVYDKWQKKNNEKVKKYMKKYYLDHYEGIREKQSNFAKSNRKNKKEYDKNYKSENKEIIRKKSQNYYLKNRDNILQKTKEYRNKNPDKMIKWKSENQEHIKEYGKKYHKNYKDIFNERRRYRQKNDINFKIINSYRNRLRIALKGMYKTKISIEYLDCTIDEFKKYIKRQFLIGMTWNNYGYYGWHLDHIIPCAMFCLEHEADRIKCFHYTNLQPLWAKDNIKKGDRLYANRYSR